MTCFSAFAFLSRFSFRIRALMFIGLPLCAPFGYPLFSAKDLLVSAKGLLVDAHVRTREKPIGLAALSKCLAQTNKSSDEAVLTKQRTSRASWPAFSRSLAD